MKPIITWILITNGYRSRVIEHSAVGSGLKEVKGMELSDEVLSMSEIMADKPGRSFSTAGTSRSAMQQRTNPVDKREADFIRLVADNLNKKFSNKGFDRLIIFASPSSMGDLRKVLSEDLQNTIYAEIDKDLTKVPNDQIAKHLKDVMVV
ncbi:MAG: host attachment protein [Devosiaceae bacterium]|nr:host attachment protein [Devosiaceae bacterium]